MISRKKAIKAALYVTRYTGRQQTVYRKGDGYMFADSRDVPYDSEPIGVASLTRSGYRFNPYKGGRRW